jgi:NAD(P)H dehydrogenase (quinone)
MTMTTTPQDGDGATVLVLGATGSVGSALINELLQHPGPQPLTVRAAVRRQGAAESLLRRGAEVAFLDLDGIERHPLGEHTALRDALAGVDRLFLLTGYTVDMLVHSKAVIDAAQRAGVAHIVHLGALASEDTTIVHFGWHQMIERYIESSGIAFTHLWPTTFMQNVVRFSLRPGGVLQHFIGDARVSWVDTDDVARVAATVLRAPREHAGKSYPLGVEALSLYEVATILSDTIGVPVRYEPRSPDDFLEAVLANNLVEPAYARCVHNVFRRTAEGSMPEAEAAVFDTVERVTGTKPTCWRDHALAHREELRAASL